MRNILLILVVASLSSTVLASGDHMAEHGNHETHGSGDMGRAHITGGERDVHEGAAGQPGGPGKVNRIIEVTMNDTMRFNPSEMKFKKGETVRFVVRNEGKIRHEMVIGSVEEIKEHAEMMRKMPGMQHAEPNMVSLAPGESADLVWQFDNSGGFDFACLVPGHFEAGMTGKIEVK